MRIPDTWEELLSPIDRRLIAVLDWAEERRKRESVTARALLADELDDLLRPVLVGTTPSPC